MADFEDRIRSMTAPRKGAYPRPWMTDTDPEQVDVLIVGASSAKTFCVVDVGNHEQFLDALWNRNGQSCRAMYRAATKKPSPTRPNLDRLSRILTEHGLTSLQTNVTCASASYDAAVLQEDRAHGTAIFKTVVKRLSWKAMIVYGVGASERFGHAFGLKVPPMPSPDSAPVFTALQGRPVFISPTLASPAYRASVWPYLERVVEEITEFTKATGVQARPTLSLIKRLVPSQRPIEDTKHSSDKNLSTNFNTSAANILVRRRMETIQSTSVLEIKLSTRQASLYDRPSNTRVFRHDFTKEKADILLREDVFQFDSSLINMVPWSTHTNAKFQHFRTNDLHFLDRVMDVVAVYAAERKP